MNKRGVTLPEVLLWMIGGVAAAIVYVHSSFVTYREFQELSPRFERMEAKLDTLIGEKSK